MNENLNLVEILKDCPKGTKLYSTIYGTVKLDKIKKDSKYPIVFVTSQGNNSNTTADGRYYKNWNGECTLFPPKDQRDWSKFTAPWYKKDKFDPKTLKSFDKVLGRNDLGIWCCDFFSSYMEIYVLPNVCIGGSYLNCIPYNDDTKHLIGTSEKAPKYYRYWED